MNEGSDQLESSLSIFAGDNFSFKNSKFQSFKNGCKSTRKSKLIEVYRGVSDVFELVRSYYSERSLKFSKIKKSLSLSLSEMSKAARKVA